MKRMITTVLIAITLVFGCIKAREYVEARRSGKSQTHENGLARLAKKVAERVETPIAAWEDKARRRR